MIRMVEVQKAHVCPVKESQGSQYCNVLQVRANPSDEDLASFELEQTNKLRRSPCSIPACERKRTRDTVENGMGSIGRLLSDLPPPVIALQSLFISRGLINDLRFKNQDRP